MTEPTGRLESTGDGHRLVLERTFRAPIADVWAAVTEPERMARWIGTWSGDPATGTVSFLMTAEGQAEPEEVEIRECDPPYVLRVTTRQGEGSWHLELELSEADGVTTLRFLQPGVDPAQAGSVGPGWEYYLDRLVAAESGGDVAAIDFERDYFPAMEAFYRT
jgi:uncharacterized protein YndB with AHSA1/START domain